MQLSPLNVQAGLRFLIKSLGNLNLGVQLEENAEALSGLVRSGIQLFKFFCEAEKPGTKTDLIRGDEAYAAIWTKVAADKNAGAPISPAQLEQLQTYLWLAAEHHAEIVDFLKTHATEVASAHKKKGGGSKATAAAGSTSASSSSAGKNAPAEDKGKARALAMFHA